ncbi:hypothetical protein AgCh_010257 [Apium graveolens]
MDAFLAFLAFFVIVFCGVPVFIFLLGKFCKHIGAQCDDVETGGARNGNMVILGAFGDGGEDGGGKDTGNGGDGGGCGGGCGD